MGLVSYQRTLDSIAHVTPLGSSAPAVADLLLCFRSRRRYILVSIVNYRVVNYFFEGRRRQHCVFDHFSQHPVVSNQPRGSWNWVASVPMVIMPLIISECDLWSWGGSLTKSTRKTSASTLAIILHSHKWLMTSFLLISTRAFKPDSLTMLALVFYGLLYLFSWVIMLFYCLFYLMLRLLRGEMLKGLHMSNIIRIMLINYIIISIIFIDILIISL